ncbi:hypothetical protein CEXT_542631 [Caerostris extrusa]|uniref:Uncharacterized protein n=1 Tax=Caerostris extrusa TaxID=172846 RepID=A0AAV4PTL0_CAEEX|nr:hypothetical protein CEXT_542631 [Caerostris extrusa]
MFAQAAAYGTEMILARALVIRRRLRAFGSCEVYQGLPGPSDNSPEEDLSEIFGCGFPFSQCGRDNFRSLANGRKEVIIDGFLRSSESCLCYC